MAKKKRRRRPSGGPTQRPPQQQASTQGPEAPAKGGVSQASAARRERKDEARAAREAALRRYRRQRIFRRVAIWGVAGVVVIVGYTFLTANHHDVNKQLLRRAEAAADRAGCTGIEVPASNPEAGLHDPPYTYTQNPPTSGHHQDPLPSEPHVYPTPVEQPHAVHNLEHGYILIYYQPDGSDALDSGVQSALEDYADSQNKVIMAPYPQLDPGQSLALAAWNRLQQCPASITSDDALVLAKSFVDQFREAGEAPEPNGV